MSEFVHLHVHSFYSLLDGLGSPRALIKKAKDQGMQAIAVTDHGVMYGVIEFYQEAKKAGIKPIIGCEIYVAPESRFSKKTKADGKPFHLTVLAKNNVGYHNLIQLTTKAHLEGYYYRPRVDFELLKQYGEGLIALSGCLASETSQALMVQDAHKAKEAIKKYQECFGKENFYLEVQERPGLPEQQVVNKELIKLSKETGVPLVATNDAHYVNTEDRDAHDVLICVQTGKTVNDEDRMKYEGDFSIVSAEEMAEKWKEHPEAIENTVKIAEQCNVEIELGQDLIPQFKTPEGKTAEEYLRELCELGFKKRYPNPTPEARERLDYELKNIHNMGFDTYFLIVWDVIHYAKNAGITVGPGRGSAAGSIVAYTLEITDLDPLEHGLVFERFLNPERVSMPDIDMDFADERRGEVLSYVVEKYGRENVAQIITFGTMAARAAIRDVGRVLGMNYGDVDRVAKLVPGRPGTKLVDVLKQADMRGLYESSEQNKKLLDMAQKLEGVVRHASTHACAIVISEKPLTDYSPLQMATKGETSIVTQYSMKPLEKLGLLKIDFLGLKNLTILEEAVRIIEQTQGQKIVLTQLPLNDKKTFELLGRGETTGVFQLESSGMKRYLKELKPSVFEDITAMVSLYRPGPMELITDYIEGKYGRKKITYLHPVLEPILAPTYGIAVYQEQVLQLARDFAGFTMGEADVLRRAIGKKIKSELDAQREKFIQGAMNKGVERRLAERVFSFIEPFANYGFNKSHAACYALIAYQTAYLKAHYPSEFMAALLTADQDDTDRITIEVNECREMGIQILPPSVNESDHRFTVTGSRTVRFGLKAIKNLGDGPVEAVLRARKEGGKFTSLSDFARRTDAQFINKKMLEALAMSGAFDDIAAREVVVGNIDRITSFAKKIQTSVARGQGDLFSGLSLPEQSQVQELDLDPPPPISDTQKLLWERELLGIYVSHHPLADFKDLYTSEVTPINKIVKSFEGRRRKIAGIITQIKRITTKTGQPMLFITVEDLVGRMEVLVFPKLLLEKAPLFQKDRTVLLEGRISFKDRQNQAGVEPKLLCDQVSELTKEMNQKSSVVSTKSSAPAAANASPFEILIPAGADLELLSKVKYCLSKYPGSSPCYLLLQDLASEKRSKIHIPVSVEISQQLVAEVNLLLGHQAVSMEHEEIEITDL